MEKGVVVTNDLNSMRTKNTHETTQRTAPKTERSSNLRVTEQVVHSFFKVLQVEGLQALGEVLVVVIRQSQHSEALPSQQASPVLQKATSNAKNVHNARKGPGALGRHKTHNES